MQPIRQLAANIEAAFAPPKRGRGRPQKSDEDVKKTPCLVPFGIVTSSIVKIPAADRPAVKDEARGMVNRDKGCRSAVPLFNTLLDKFWWSDGLLQYQSMQDLAEELGNNRSTVVRQLRALEDRGHLLRRRVKNAVGDWDVNEYTLPTVLTAWQNLQGGRCKEFDGVGANKSGGRCTDAPGGRCKDAPLPFGVSKEGSDGCSAHARENTEDAVQSFLKGEDLGKADGLKPVLPDGLTEEHLYRFHALADTFGRKAGQIILNPVQRSDSDRMLADLVATLLPGFPADVIECAVAATLLKAQSIQLANNQEGALGKGRGGITRLTNYLVSTLRPVANDLMREKDTSEAKNRSEKAVHQERHKLRVNAVRSPGRTGRPSRKTNEELMAEVMEEGAPCNDL